MSDLLPRIDRYRRLGFGLFVHYGLYSLRGRGEWSWRHHDGLAPGYVEALLPRFDAAGFDADAICAAAAGAGCRYACLTTRHHEGFSLYDTRGLNDFDAPRSPAGRDLVAEFSAACERHGLAKVFYHTTLDWWHPAFDRDWDAYQAYLRDSVEILCRHYGRVDGLWFDGNWSRRDRDWQEDALYGLIRERQPDCVIVNNSSHGHHGEATHPELDAVTFEQGEASAVSHADGKRRAGEVCETITSHWGAADGDLSHTSPAWVIERLVACRRVGANLLLNVGPAGDGSLPAYEAALLELVGRWTRVCPMALGDALPTGLRCRGRDAVVADGERFYAFVHNVPIAGNRHLLRGDPGDGWQVVAGELPPIATVTWADSGEALRFEQGAGHLIFEATPWTYGSSAPVRIAVLEPVGG